MGKRLDLVGQKFNRLYVLEFAGMNKWQETTWLCRCGCGNVITVVGKNLVYGKSQSCGCISKEITIKRNKLGQSEESRKKMSEVKKGKGCGKDNPFYGKKHSEESKRRISKSLKGRFIGKDNPNWKSNISDEDRQTQRKYPEYYKWRTDVFERDNYTCQVCGDNIGGNLIAHHLESYRDNPKLRTTLSNGTTVCEKHHLDFHHQYGYGHNTRKQFNKFKKENK